MGRNLKKEEKRQIKENKLTQLIDSKYFLEDEKRQIKEKKKNLINRFFKNRVTRFLEIDLVMRFFKNHYNQIFNELGKEIP